MTTTVEVRPWRLATLAGMASYLDAGTIIAVSAALTHWRSTFGMSSWQVGFLSATLTVCIGIGAIVGGRIGDRHGRKRVYAADLMIYGFGLLWLVCAGHPAMLFVGVSIVGLAIGADVPAALALVGENAPVGSRGRLVTFTQFLWALGPLVVVLLELAGTPLGHQLPRAIFAHLLVLALLTWLLRRRMVESLRWRPSRSTPRELFTPTLRRGTLVILLFYATLTIGTNFYGSFGLYALEQIGGLGASGALAASLIPIPLIVLTVLAMLPAMDTSARRPLFMVGAVVQILSWLSLLVLPVHAATLIAALTAYGIGNTVAGEAHYKLWCQENFPTRVRSTAIGLSFGLARMASAATLVFIPSLLHRGFATLVALMVVLTIASAALGLAVRTRGASESIEDIDARLTP
ncbi:MFS transporter [Nocardia panacis]|uniref:MFS transporter n=1 Tax=Nocardia panacis TaxID=2340916 RepID=UPI0013151B62|nr:MFS transporter [Nocardia panacis]